MYTDLAHIVSEVKLGNAQAQKALYDQYKGILMGIARRYMKNIPDAEDVLIEAFYKIFNKIKSYKGEGSFEGWMKRIVVNEALMALRKKANFNMTVEVEDLNLKVEPLGQQNLEYNEILAMIDQLPTGYRTIFNMYVIEGYKHREIAEQLGISINTSKSQLILAKKKLQGFIKKKNRQAGL